MVYKTDEASVKHNIQMIHNRLMKTSKKFQREGEEGRYIETSNALMKFYYDEVGISNNNLWNRINDLTGEFYDLELFIYQK